MTERLASALDNAKVSDGMAVHILIAAAQALEQNIDSLILNRSSIQRARRKFREQKVKDIQSEFANVSPSTTFC